MVLTGEQLNVVFANIEQLKNEERFIEDISVVAQVNIGGLKISFISTISGQNNYLTTNLYFDSSCASDYLLRYDDFKRNVLFCITQEEIWRAMSTLAYGNKPPKKEKK